MKNSRGKNARARSTVEALGAGCGKHAEVKILAEDRRGPRVADQRRDFLYLINYIYNRLTYYIILTIDESQHLSKDFVLIIILLFV